MLWRNHTLRGKNRESTNWDRRTHLGMFFLYLTARWSDSSYFILYSNILLTIWLFSLNWAHDWANLESLCITISVALSLASNVFSCPNGKKKRKQQCQWNENDKGLQYEVHDCWCSGRCVTLEIVKFNCRYKNGTRTGEMNINLK